MIENIASLKQRAERGDTEAQYLLGDHYWNGMGVQTNYSEAFKWYEKSAWGGNMWGKYNYGKCFRLGRGVGKDEERARHEFRLSAEMGNPWALLQLAEMGDTDAMYKVGDHYWNGDRQDIGMPQNDSEAFKWYEKSARGGNEWGFFNCGKCYTLGRGCRRNRELACDAFGQAAARGNQWAIAWLQALAQENYSTTNLYTYAVRAVIRHGGNAWVPGVGSAAEAMFLLISGDMTPEAIPGHVIKGVLSDTDLFTDIFSDIGDILE